MKLTKLIATLLIAPAIISTSATSAISAIDINNPRTRTNPPKGDRTEEPPVESSFRQIN